MKQIDTPTRQKRKLYISPTILGISFVCEKGFATSFKSTDGSGTESSSSNQLQNFGVESGTSSELYF